MATSLCRVAPASPACEKWLESELTCCEDRGKKQGQRRFEIFSWRLRACLLHVQPPNLARVRTVNCGLFVV